MHAYIHTYIQMLFQLVKLRYVTLGSIYAHSSRLFRVDGHSLPYAWNHQISYDRDYGKMPYLVERLTADDVSIDFDVSREVLQYQLTASIAKGTYHSESNLI